MKHSEFVKALAADLQTVKGDDKPVTLEEARQVLKAFTRSFYYAMVRYGHLDLKQIGIFRVLENAERKMTSGLPGLKGQKIEVPASKRTTFKMAAALKRELKGGGS